jgi:hypothetical protein
MKTETETSPPKRCVLKNNHDGALEKDNTMDNGSRDSVVGIATSYGLDD